MAQSKLTKWNDASGSQYEQLLRPDGSYRQWKDGKVVAEDGPDDGRAEAFNAGEYDAVAEATRAGDAWLDSRYGQRVVKQEEDAGVRAREISDRDYGLAQDRVDQTKRSGDQTYSLGKGQLGVSRDTLNQTVKEQDRRFGLDETEKNRRYDLDKTELDRRFGLDSSKFGVDYFKVATDYAKTPRSWLESTQFSSPGFMQRMTQGLANPSFGAQGPLPQMNSMESSLASVNGGGGAATPIYQQQAGNPAGTVSATGTPTGPGGVPLVDPSVNIKKILAGSPPSAESGFSDQDIAAVKLIAELYKNGAGKMKEGTMESWSPEQLGVVQGVGDYLSPNGGDKLVSDYKATRIPRSANPFSAA